MKNKKYFVKVNPRWIEVFTNKEHARTFARTYGVKVTTKIEDWQVNTAIVITLIVLVVLSFIFAS